MRLGFVGTSLEEAAAVAAAGYDFLEIKGDMVLGNETSFRCFVTDMERLDIPLEAMTSPLPFTAGLTLIGPDADHEAAASLLRLCLSRGAALGVRTVVFDCAWARSIPPGVSPKLATSQLVHFLGRAGDIAKEQGLRIGLEALSRKETNWLNSAEELRDLVWYLGRDEIGIALDFYHLTAEDLSVERELAAAGDCLVHVQTADPSTRSHPGADQEIQRPLIAGLIKAGYEGRLSVDCLTDNPREETRSSIRALRGLIKAETSRV